MRSYYIGGVLTGGTFHQLSFLGLEFNPNFEIHVGNFRNFFGKTLFTFKKANKFKLLIFYIAGAFLNILFALLFWLIKEPVWGIFNFVLGFGTLVPSSSLRTDGFFALSLLKNRPNTLLFIELSTTLISEFSQNAAQYIPQVIRSLERSESDLSKVELFFFMTYLNYCYTDGFLNN